MTWNNAIYISGILVCLLFGLSVSAQPTILWERSLGGSSLETFYAMKETLDYGYILAGPSFSSDGDVGVNNGGGDCWIVRLHSDGSIFWKKNYGGEATEVPYDICCMSDGGFAFVGLTNSLGGDVQGNHGLADVWVVRIDSMGALLWQKCLGGSMRDVGYGLQTTADDGLIICGETESIDGDVGNSFGSSDVWLVKLNRDGEIEWENSFGGADGDAARDVQHTSDGGYMFFGETFSSDGQVTGQHGNNDCWLGKVTNLGDLEWQRTLGGSYSDRGWTIHPAQSGGFYLMGVAGSPDGDVEGWHGNYDYWIVKINESGDIIWQKVMGGFEDDYGLSVFGTKDNGCLAVGATMSTDGDVLDNDGFRDIWVIKLDSSGQEMWQKTLGGTGFENSRCAFETYDHHFLIGGDSYSSDGDVSTNHGSSDFWIVKLSPETSSTSTPSAILLNPYPNPAQNWFSINLPITESDMRVSVTDAQGRVVLANTIRSDERLDISGMTAGAYTVSVVSKSGQLYTGMLVKD